MRRVKHHSLHVFSVQMGLLLRSGTRLVQALKIAGSSEDPALNEAVARVGQAVSAGVSLSKAMEREPQAFPVLYVRLVAMAEQVGALAVIFDRLARYLSHQGTVRRSLIAGLTYPLAVLLMSLGLLGVLRLLLLPSFLQLVGQYGTHLPWLTRMISFDLPAWAWVTLGLVGLGLLEALYLTWRHPGGRQGLQDFFYALPGVGRGLYQWQWCRLSRDLATLVGSGVPMLRALTLLGDQPWPSLRVQASLEQGLLGVRAGQSLSEALAGQPGVPPMLVHLVAAGEISGRLPALLERYSDIGEEALKLEIDTALKLFEPLLLAALGLGVGLVLLAAFLPIYQLMLSL